MKFQREMFDYHGGYLTYGAERKFVARFKHRGPVKKADFVRLLCKYYDTESYFNRIAKDEAPLQVFMNDKLVQFDMTARRFLIAK